MKHSSFKTSGFTLIELILVVSIISILVVLYASVGSSFLVKNYTQNTTNDLVSKIRLAQLNSMFSKKDSAWGVRIQNNQIILFEGTTFASRNPTYDEVSHFPATVSISPNNSEFLFSKSTGTSNTATLTVSNNVGDTSTVSINEEGIVDVN